MMVKTTKDVKISKRNKENIRPPKVMKITSDEKAKRSKKYTKRYHGKCGDARNKKRKFVKQNIQMKVKNKSSIKTSSKKVDKTTIILKPTKVQKVEANPYISPTDYLNKAVHKSLNNIPLTHVELEHLFNKYKRDGHYRINMDLPPFTTIMDNPEEDAVLTSQTPRQTKMPDYKTSLADSKYTTPHRYQCISTKKPANLQVHTNDRVNDIDTRTFIQENTPVNESYNSSFSDTYIMSYNNINVPNTLQDTARMQCSDSFNQIYSDNENPYDLSYRTSCSSMSHSNTAYNMSSFENESFQDNSLQDNTFQDNTLRNHNFVDSYIPPLNQTFFENDNGCLNMHNNNDVSSAMNKDNGFVDKLCNVITHVWDNKQLTQVFPGGNIDSYSYKKLNTNDTLLGQVQDSTIIENHLKQNGVPADMSNMYHLPHIKNHVYHPYKNETDIDHNFSTVPCENTLRAPTFMTAPALAPNLLYDVNNF